MAYHHHSHEHTMLNPVEAVKYDREFVVTVNCTITLDDLAAVAKHSQKVVLHPDLKSAIDRNREVVDNFTKSGDVAYGINTGFGSLKDVIIPPNDLELLQSNLICSHAIGTGMPIPTAIVRAMMFSRLVGFSNAASGVRYCVLEHLAECLNKNFISFVPDKGSVGASGDLIPLSHLVYGLMGHGLAFDVETGTYVKSKDLMAKLDIIPLVLNSKEGLALNNGTQFITSITAFAVVDALRLMDLLIPVLALCVEALHGTYNAFHPFIHYLKPHPGQIEIAKRMLRALMPDSVDKFDSENFAKYGSEIFRTYAADKTQDAYSLRCIPQILGQVLQIIESVRDTILIEINSVSDNPLVDTDNCRVISGGNFHGMPIGLAADQLSLATATISNLLYCIMDRFMNKNLNAFLPDFLVKDSGLNSGLMIHQYSVAALTAENRTLANPGCVHSLSTCNGTEDIVSMAGTSSRKSQTSVDNTFKILAYVLYAGCHALSFTPEKPNRLVANLFDQTMLVSKLIEKDCYAYDDVKNILSMLYTIDIDHMWSKH